MTKILHTADLHLKEVGDERWQALEQLIKTAQENQVDALTIAGDLFDHDLDANLIRENLRSLFAQTKFKTIIIPGNHDLNSFQQGFFFGNQVEIIDQLGKSVGVNDAQIWGLPFQAVTSSKQSLALISELNKQLDPRKKNVLLFHGELTDLFFKPEEFGNEGDKRYLPVNLNYFTHTKFDYVLAGHFHARFHQKKLGNNRLEQGGYFVYPGSPASITTKEVGVRKAALIEVGNPPKEIDLPTHFYKPLQLELRPESTASVINNLEQKLKQQPENARVLLSVSGYFDHQQLGLNETQLFTQLQKLAAKFKTKFDQADFEAKDISLVLDSGLYQLFIKKLNDGDFSPNQKKQMQNLLTQAMIQLNS